MSLRNLQALLAVAEHGAFAAAAEALGVTQSAVSMRVKALEEEFGAPLLDRSRRPAVLNATGRALAPRARRIVADYDAARASLRGAREVEGRIRLGAVGSVQTALLPRVLAQVRSRHPRLNVEIISGFSHELAGQVDRGALDAAIVSDFAPPGEGIAWRPFLRERLILIAPPDAPEAGAAALARLYPFIRYAPRAALGRVIEQAIAAARLEVRESMQLDWLEAVEAMVQAGHGREPAAARGADAAEVPDARPDPPRGRGHGPHDGGDLRPARRPGPRSWRAGRGTSGPGRLSRAGRRTPLPADLV
jgi:DNA-binding transcriptional LysR family regulator